MRTEAFIQVWDEDRIKFQTFRSMHGHDPYFWNTWIALSLDPVLQILKQAGLK